MIREFDYLVRFLVGFLFTSVVYLMLQNVRGEYFDRVQDNCELRLEPEECIEFHESNYDTVQDIFLKFSIVLMIALTVQFVVFGIAFMNKIISLLPILIFVTLLVVAFTIF